MQATIRAALTTLALAISPIAYAQEVLNIALAHGNEREQAAKSQLQDLLAKFDCTKWIYTREVVIEAGAIPHSHPTLTLNTRHWDRSDLLLSTFLHEQMHWFLDLREDRTEAAIRELRGIYPKVPIGFPEGSEDEHGNYEHLLVAYLEYQADKELLGEAAARRVMDFWKQDHYKWIYATVLRDEAAIGRVIQKYELLPSPVPLR